ncbi:MAG: tetratricopeptide repeat protein [Candidatus Rokubacteria bacterium]|nr:tetratricopeptide repeat protein [Candidatus Rokubacteria bacterium]
MRRFGPFLVLLVFLGGAPALAGGPTREQALAALGDASDADARRRGARQLGEVGTMADLPHLVRALRDADPLVRALAESGMWQVWSRSGDEETDRLFAIGVEQMSARQTDAAVETFTRVIQRRPDFAEGWNKRATVYFLRGEYEKSLADCDEVMKRNAYHFGALSGYGMIYLELNAPARALEYFERALRVNPNLLQVEAAVETLRQLLIQRRKDTI